LPVMVRWLADQFGVPDHLLKPALPTIMAEELA